MWPNVMAFHFESSESGWPVRTGVSFIMTCRVTCSEPSEGMEQCKWTNVYLLWGNMFGITFIFHLLAFSMRHFTEEHVNVYMLRLSLSIFSRLREILFLSTYQQFHKDKWTIVLKKFATEIFVFTLLSELNLFRLSLSKENAYFGDLKLCLEIQFCIFFSNCL